MILTTHFCLSVLLGLRNVFLLHGSDLHLDVKKSVVLDKKTDFFWKYNITNYVGKISYNKEAILFDSYEGRAEVFGRNFSLVLKNVKHSDCGDYAAVVVGGQEQSIAEYKVIVQGTFLLPVQFLNVDTSETSIHSFFIPQIQHLVLS